MNRFIYSEILKRSYDLDLSGISKMGKNLVVLGCKYLFTMVHLDPKRPVWTVINRALKMTLPQTGSIWFSYPNVMKALIYISVYLLWYETIIFCFFLLHMADQVRLPRCDSLVFPKSLS